MSSKTAPIRKKRRLSETNEESRAINDTTSSTRDYQLFFDEKRWQTFRKKYKLKGGMLSRLEKILFELRMAPFDVGDMQRIKSCPKGTCWRIRINFIRIFLVIDKKARTIHVYNIAKRDERTFKNHRCPFIV